jgi:hypothetical protein
MYTVPEDNNKMDLKEIGGMVWFGFIWLRRGTSYLLSKYSNLPSDSIKCGKWFHYLINSKLV